MKRIFIVTIVLVVFICSVKSSNAMYSASVIDKLDARITVLEQQVTDSNARIVILEKQVKDQQTIINMIPTQLQKIQELIIQFFNIFKKQLTIK
jgi:uncharacterized coiled-coil protein SlyX